jgi:hypothetical protein
LLLVGVQVVMAAAVLVVYELAQQSLIQIQFIPSLLVMAVQMQLTQL